MSKFDPYDHLNIAPNPDGSITRLLKIPKMPTNCDDESAESEDVICKDVVLSAEKKTKVRIFRPSKTPSKESTAGAIAKLPILFYYHGGFFIMYDVADEIQHMHCVQFTTELPAIVISLDYRLAPENRLPASYDDAVDALLWLKQQALDPKGEPWLREYADFSKCYLLRRV
ncbi:hypothetical protein L1049_017921 [Liquidambar formosana]|uniref:Alpha/beta hydrolase fold-3 domain-containing protein n=1 Tax=Liquidambar formosana TaxID=63359 RepID=A0AAP0NMM4_LIQFO